MSSSADEPIIVWLEDGSEIEITVIEMEGNRAKVIVCADDEIEVIREQATT